MLPGGRYFALELFLHLLVHALEDSLGMLPFLFAAYLLMEWLEHRSGERMEAALARARCLGPLAGALLGCVPQCGFSVAAANLYAGRIITPGALVAVFLSTSDEAVPILLGAPEKAGMILPLLGVKAALGLGAGLLVDAFWRRRAPGAEDPREGVHALCEHCRCEERGILPAALRHTAGVFLFILPVNFLLGGAVELLGEERLASLLLSGSFLQPLAAALLGLIPNCAASVLLTRLYLEGALGFGSLIAGLASSAGVGLLVLWRMNPRPRENLALTGLIRSTLACGTMCYVSRRYVKKIKEALGL